MNFWTQFNRRRNRPSRLLPRTVTGSAHEDREAAITRLSLEDRRLDTSDGLLRRICGEYREMPGLRLTCRQAQCFWALDEDTCRACLENLVETGFLRHTDAGSYALRT